MALRPESSSTPAWRFVAILAICAPLLAPLHAPGILNPDEGRYAEIGREMAATGDWLVPRLNGVPHWAKPPLTYWGVAASLRVFGTTERAARLPSAVAAVLTLAATWFLARGIGGGRVALLSVVMLATLLEFHALGRALTADMVQTAFITWAAAFAWNARSRSEEGAAPVRRPFLVRMLPFASLGVAFLAKGPVGLGVFFSALLVYLVLRARTKILSWRDLAPGLLLTFAIGLPWFLLVARLHPDLPDFFLGSEVRDRVLTEHGRGKAFWFLPAVLAAGTLPWTLALAAGLNHTIRGLLRRGSVEAADSDDAGRFLLAWIAGPFVLFSLSGSKMATYLLPIMPVCAIVGARWVAGLPDVRRTARAWISFAAIAPAIVALGASMKAIGAYGGPRGPWMSAAAAVLAASLVVLGMIWIGKGLRPVIAVFLTALLMLAWEWIVPFLADDRLNFRSHASQSWVREALAGELVRGAPIDESVRPAAEPPRGPPPTFVKYRLRANSLGFYALGLRPEAVPLYGTRAEWEIQSDQDAARISSLADLAALLDASERVHVITRESLRSEIESAAGRPLRLVRSYGKGEHAVVLLANR